MMTPDTASILSNIKSIEAQLAALKARLRHLAAGEQTPTHTFADLYGRLAGQADSTEAEIDAVLYRHPPAAEEAA